MLIRLTSKRSLNRALRHGALIPSNQSWHPYPASSIICLFECKKIEDIISKYGAACTQGHSLYIDDFLYIIEIILEGDNSNINQDKSQNGWVESRVYSGCIPIENIKILGRCRVKDSSLKIDCLEKYEPFRIPLSLASLKEEDLKDF